MDKSIKYLKAFDTCTMFYQLTKHNLIYNIYITNTLNVFKVYNIFRWFVMIYYSTFSQLIKNEGLNLFKSLYKFKYSPIF